MKSFRKVGDVLPVVLKPIFRGKKTEFLIINNLAKNWAQIVGFSLAKSCKIKQIKLQKSDFFENDFQKKSAANNFSSDLNSSKPVLKLIIAAFDSATAFCLKSDLQTIIARINSLYGNKQTIKIAVIIEPKFEPKLGEANNFQVKNQATNFFELINSNNSRNYDFVDFVAEKKPQKPELSSKVLSKIHSKTNKIADLNLAEILKNLGKEIHNS